jgi:hypothetical protein
VTAPHVYLEIGTRLIAILLGALVAQQPSYGESTNGGLSEIAAVC